MARLGDICRFQSGGTPSKNEPTYFNGNIPWITTVALNGNIIDADDAVDWITEKAITKSAAKIVPAHSIMIGTRVGVGKVAINATPMSTSQDIISLIGIDENKWSKPYLCKFILGQSEFLNTQARGATIKGIKIDILAELNVPDISLSEQCHIASVLDKVSELTALRKQQLDKLDELVKARFVEMFGDLGNPLCSWEKKRLVDICISSDDIKCGPFGTQLSKDEYQVGGIAVWEIPQINSNFKTSPTHFLTAEKANQLRAYSIEPGDIAMSRKGNVGRCALFPDCFKPGIIHSDVLRIRVNHKVVLPRFMMCQLHYSAAVQHQIDLVSSGAIMAGVNVTKLKEIIVHIPPLNLQAEFNVFMGKTEKCKLTIQQGLDKLELMKKALMQQYFG